MQYADSYCDCAQSDVPIREDVVDARRDEIIRSDRELIAMLRDAMDDREHEIADAIRLALERDDLAAGDRIRGVFTKAVNELAEWKAERA